MVAKRLGSGKEEKDLGEARMKLTQAERELWNAWKAYSDAQNK